jgi:hypothetical protein
MTIYFRPVFCTGHQSRHVIVQERSPRLRGWSPMTPHVLSDAGLADVDAEFEEFALDTWRAPQRVLSVQPSDQFAHVVWNRWPSRPPASPLPLPKQPKARAMPRDDGGRLGDDEGGSPFGPGATKPPPEEPIRRGQLGSLHRTLEDTELVTQREHLELKGRAATNAESTAAAANRRKGQLSIYPSNRDLRETGDITGILRGSKPGGADSRRGRRPARCPGRRPGGL